MSEHERKLAESDAYLRKLQAKTAASRPKMSSNMSLVGTSQKREKMAQMERDLELSQMSNWTAESQFNIDAKEKEMIKKKQQNVLDNIYKTGLPDREQLVDTIVALRVDKNAYEEENRLLKVNCAKLKK